MILFIEVNLLSLYESGVETGPRWAIWVKNLMGFATSPYNSIKMVLVAEEVCQGNHSDEGLGLDGKQLNPFQWKRI